MRTREPQISPRHLYATTQELAPPHSSWSCNVKVSDVSDVCNGNFLYRNGNST